MKDHAMPASKDARNEIRNRKRRLEKYPRNLSELGLRIDSEKDKFYFVPVFDRVYTPGIFRNYPYEGSCNAFINYCVCSDILTEILGIQSPLWADGFCTGCDNPAWEGFHDDKDNEYYRYHFISEADAVSNPYDLDINYRGEYEADLQRIRSAGFDIEEIE